MYSKTREEWFDEAERLQAELETWKRRYAEIAEEAQAMIAAQEKG